MSGTSNNGTNPATMKRLLSHGGMRVPVADGKHSLGDNNAEMKRSGS